VDSRVAVPARYGPGMLITARISADLTPPERTKKFHRVWYFSSIFQTGY